MDHQWRRSVGFEEEKETPLSLRHELILMASDPALSDD